ncbi:folylpolyglutamate synthase-like, partial [Thraustotheca clavata]
LAMDFVVADVDKFRSRGVDGAMDLLLSLPNRPGNVLPAGPKDTRESTIELMKSYMGRLNMNISPLSIVHIAGTKGKGSTSAFTESILRAHGAKTGMFTSPHLIHVCERFRINGKPISEEMFLTHFWAIWDGLYATKDQVKNEPPMAGFFRFFTLLAFRVFLAAGVDVAILEVGLGGRLDATNVVEKPVVCGVTMLDLDHTRVLGETLDLIAREKAGIFKRGVPAFTITQPKIAADMLVQCAIEHENPLFVIPSLQEFNVDVTKLGLHGDYQQVNAALAIVLATQWLHRKKPLALPLNYRELVTPTIMQGLTSAFWPGRAQTIADPKSSTMYYIDGAHTPMSMQCCSDWYRQNCASNTIAHRVLIFNCHHERDIVRIFQPLFDISFDHVIFTPSRSCRPSIVKIPSVKEALVKAGVRIEGLAATAFDMNNCPPNGDKLYWQYNCAKIWKILCQVYGRVAPKVTICNSVEDSIALIRTTAPMTPSAPLKVLTMRSLLQKVFTYQNGLYFDLIDLFRFTNDVVKIDKNGDYCWPGTTVSLSSTKKLYLPLLEYDFRFPVHYTIVDGDLIKLQRIAQCHPEYFTKDALYCALANNAIQIANYLLELNLQPGLVTTTLLDLAIPCRDYNLLKRLVKMGYGCGANSTINLAAELGDLYSVQFLFFHGYDASQAIDKAAGSGHLNIIEFLHRMNVRGVGPGAIDCAAMNGHASIVAYLLTYGYTNSTTAWNLAANDGYLEVIKLLHEFDAPHCTSNAMDFAATEGHLNVVQFLHTFRTEGATVDAIDGAAGNGHLEIVNFLIEHRLEGWSHCAMDDAAFNGHAHIIIYFLQHYNACDIKVSQRAINSAASNGHNEILQLLLQAQLPEIDSNIDAVCGAAQNGHLEVVKILYEFRNSAWNSSVWFAALQYPSIMQFLFENAPECIDWQLEFGGKEIPYASAVVLQNLANRMESTIELDEYYPGYEMFTIHTSQACYLELVQFFPTYPWDSKTMRSAVLQGKLSCVQYLHEHLHDQCCPHDDSLLIAAVGLDDDNKIFSYLFTNCKACEVTSDVWRAAARHKNLPLIQLLHENNCKGASSKTIDQAAIVGALDIIKFLQLNRYEGCTSVAMYDAFYNFQWRVVRHFCIYGQPGVSTKNTISSINSAIQNLFEEGLSINPITSMTLFPLIKKLEESTKKSYIS